MESSSRLQRAQPAFVRSVPMLDLAGALPTRKCGGVRAEKWDGFRCLPIHLAGSVRFTSAARGSTGQV